MPKLLCLVMEGRWTPPKSFSAAHCSLQTYHDDHGYTACIISLSSKCLCRLDTSMTMSDTNPKLHLHPQQLRHKSAIVLLPTNSEISDERCETSWMSHQAALPYSQVKAIRVCEQLPKERLNLGMDISCLHSAEGAAHGVLTLCPAAFTHPLMTVLWHCCLRAPVVQWLRYNCNVFSNECKI